MKEYVIDIKKWQRPCIYMLIKETPYYCEDMVVYVGQSVRGIERIFEHKDKDFDYIKYIPCPKTKLNQREKELIEKYQPKYNEMLKPYIPSRFEQFLKLECCYHCKYSDFEEYIKINNIPDEAYYDEVVPTYCMKHQKNIQNSFIKTKCEDFKMSKLQPPKAKPIKSKTL